MQSVNIKTCCQNLKELDTKIKTAYLSLQTEIKRLHSTPSAGIINDEYKYKTRRVAVNLATHAL